MTRSERKAQGNRQKDSYQTYLAELEASAAKANGDRNGDPNSSDWWFEEGDITQQQPSEWPPASPATSGISARSRRRRGAASAAAAAAIDRATTTATGRGAGAAAGGFDQDDTRPWGRTRETEEGRGLRIAAVASSSRDAENEPPAWSPSDEHARHGNGWQGWEGAGGGRWHGWEGSDEARVGYGGTGHGHDDGAGGVNLPLEAAPLRRASELGFRVVAAAPWPGQRATQEGPWRGKQHHTKDEPAAPPVYQWNQSGRGSWHQQPGNPWQLGGGVSWPSDAAAQAPGVTDGRAADPLQGDAHPAEETTAAAFAVRDEVAARLVSVDPSAQLLPIADWQQVAPEGLTVGQEGEGETPTEPPDLAAVRRSARWGSRWGLAVAGGTSEAPMARPATGDPQVEERLWARLQSARPASPSPSPPPLPPPLPDVAPEESPPTPAAEVAPESPPALEQSAPALAVSARIASSPRPAVVAAAADLPRSSDPVDGSVESRGAAVVRRAGDGLMAGKQDAERKRAALRNWRSAAYEHALVLVGAANLPRKACALVAKMPGAVWVDRHELAERSSLPLEVKASLAKALADRMPVCGSCDDNETGRDHVLLMTFSSAEHKTAAVGRLTELAVDTTDFANSPGLQVEHARAVPPPPPMPSSPPPCDVGQLAGLPVDATDLDYSPGLEAEHSCEGPPPPPPPGPAPPQSRTVDQLAELAGDTMDLESSPDLQEEHACEPRPPSRRSPSPPPHPAGPDIPTAVAMAIPPSPAESQNIAAAEKESSSVVAQGRPVGKVPALSGRLAEARVRVLKALKAERAIAAATKARAESKGAKGRDGVKKAGAKRAAQAAGAGMGAATAAVGKVSGIVQGGAAAAAAAAASKRAKVGSSSSPGAPADRTTPALKGSGRVGSSTAAGKTSTSTGGVKAKVKAKTKVKVKAKGKPAAEEAPARPVDAPVAPPASRASGASPAPSADAINSAKPSPAPRPSRPGQPRSDKPTADPSGRKEVTTAGGAPAALSSSPVPPARRTPSPVPPARRTPSPVPPPSAVQKASVVQSISAAAPRTAPPPARALSPTRRVIGIGHCGAASAAQAGAGAADRVLPPLKALSKRLVVLRPSGPPDLTMRKWDYGFSGPYFRLLDRDVKTGEPLPCDASKNTSYVGVIPPSEVILAGLREHSKQRRSAAAAADVLAAAGAVAVAAANGDASSRSNSSGSGSVDAGESTALSAPVPRTAPPPRQPQQRAVSMIGKQTLLATVPSAGAPAAPARLEGGILAEKDLGGAMQEVVAGGTGSTREVAAGGTGRALRGNLGARIRQAEDELRLLQEMKIPRVMEALADVSQQRRKLESIATSVAVKRAAAHARLARDSRDAASALMGELNARRQASQQQKQQQQQQQKRSQLLHGGGGDEGISGADGSLSREISSLPLPASTAAAISPPAAATVAATAPEAALTRVAPNRSPAADGGAGIHDSGSQVADRVGPLDGRPGTGGGEARDPRVRHAVQKARVGPLVK